LSVQLQPKRGTLPLHNSGSIPPNRVNGERTNGRGGVATAEREFPTTCRFCEGVTVWFTGRPSAGKTTLATALHDRLRAEDHRVEVLDGDALRTYLTRGLGFSKEDRDESVRRAGFVAHLLSRNGVTVLCALVSPYQQARDEVRALHEGGRFVEVYVSTPTEVCAERDVKGLYAKHKQGLVRGLTGVDDPYEDPVAPEVVVPAHAQTIEESVETILEALA
jgi:adenylylsulfate kinase